MKRPVTVAESIFGDSDDDGIYEQEVGGGLAPKRLRPDSFSVPSWNFIDMVEAGADPTGQESIVSVWDSEKGSNTTLYFPSGEYYIDSTLTAYGFDNFNVVSDSGAKLVPEDPNNGGEYNGTENHVIEYGDWNTQGGHTSGTWSGLNIDISSIVDVQPFKIGYKGITRFENVDVIGSMDGTIDDRSTVEFGGGNFDGGWYNHIVMEDVSLLDGSTTAADTDGHGDPKGFRPIPDYGTKWVYNCDLEGFESTGLTARMNSRDNGPVHIRGGNYGISNRASIRLGPPGSTVIGANIRIEGSTNMGTERGIWLFEGNGHYLAGNKVETIDGYNAITFGPYASGITLENTYIRSSNGTSPVRLVDPDTPRDSDLDHTRNKIKDVFIEGDLQADGIDAGWGEVDIIRPTIYNTSSTGRGIWVDDGDNVNIENPWIDVSGHPIILSGENLTVDNPAYLNSKDGSEDYWVADDSVDVNFVNMNGQGLTIQDDGATRVRYNGIIGAGPLGGVDLSTVTGGSEGDMAMSSGTTGNSGDNSYSYWTWDSANSQWHDGNGNTI